ncbi:hypothetical protein [Seonamhaeicola maritimus]|uniref:Uncharacterized protein n=1 Tax=Seonamhaeicola maritimus TaxID=2591822 RepID=A0A5C7GKV0_9FLAO|nr:hypothetical protein [Seonamhaeicola maritimus]TXG38963.1 hypothetical protein FUA22_03485 [Seonamhaeicola maritimus]
MYKTLFSLILLCTVFLSCKKEQDPFQVSKQHIGLLTDSTQVKDLKIIFATDSISKFISGDEFAGGINNIEIFKKDGNKLLILTPEKVLDSTSTIKSIQIIDPQYKTVKGISTLSTFKDINTAYKISSINNSINSLVISVKELNASFVIDKKELPANLRFDINLKFEETHIPDDAKIKYFFLIWND